MVPKVSEEIEITLPEMGTETRTLTGWGHYIEKEYKGQRAKVLTARDIATNLRNALKYPATLNNDRKLHALGLQDLPRSRRKKHEVFNTKGPTPRNHVETQFTNPLTGVNEEFDTTTKLCKKYAVAPATYYTRIKSGWTQAEALYVVIRKPFIRARMAHRNKYATWLASLTPTELQALKNNGYL
jgi:hypothetical protein